MHDVAAIVLAAGSATRFGGLKQFARVGNARLVDLSVATAAAIAGSVIVVVPRDTRWHGVGLGVPGGTTRAGSVRNGLAAVPAECDIVVVHDAAHPVATIPLARALVDEVRAGADGAVPVLPTRETVAHARGGELGASVPRDDLVLVQMPHAFRAAALHAAHRQVPDVVDDATLMQSLGHRLVTVPGDPANIHVTTPEDLELVHRFMR
jgi:2-C-methyl-D-erythritol 4-phosphate cytidylyltransferase